MLPRQSDVGQGVVMMLAMTVRVIVKCSITVLNGPCHACEFHVPCYYFVEYLLKLC